MPESAPAEASSEAALYGVVPEQFIAARDALAKRLRSEGNQAGAARVAKRRRPPLTAWALNQVAREAPDLLEALHQAGARLRAAMEQALQGDASQLRPARAEERTAVDAVVADAVSRLEGGGYTATGVMGQRLAATLRAAIVDESVAALLGQGMLDGDREAPGFGIDALTVPQSKSQPSAEEPELSAGEPEPVPPDERPDHDAHGKRSEADRQRIRRLIERRHQVRLEAQRLAAEGAAMAADADRLAAEGAKLAAQAQVVLERSADARRRADKVLGAAAVQQAEADSLAHQLAEAGAAVGDLNGIAVGFQPGAGPPPSSVA